MVAEIITPPKFLQPCGHVRTYGYGIYMEYSAIRCTEYTAWLRKSKNRVCDLIEGTHITDTIPPLNP